jgi:ABC-type Fe3+-hydroxamate transport system substrate-binding protein
MRRLLSALAVLTLAACGSLPAFAQTATPLFPLPSTPNIAIGNTATLAVVVPQGPARYVFVRNDCTQDLIFDLRGARDAAANLFPLRLKTNQEFATNMQVMVVAASAGNAASSCTFTLQFGG